MATARRQVSRAGRGRQLADCEPLSLEKTDFTRVARSHVFKFVHNVNNFLQVVNNYDNFVTLELRLFCSIRLCFLQLHGSFCLIQT